jgi:hypothetical protein
VKVRQNGRIVSVAVIVAEADRVSGHGGQIGEQRAEAVDGWPSSVRLLTALRCAAGETIALLTGERRRAWAAARPWSSNRMEASAWRICHLRW